MLKRPPLHYRDEPFHAILQNAAERDPERIALWFDGEPFTLRELDGVANAFANALLHLGVAPEDRMAIIAPNRPEWIMAQVGISQTGAAVVMPNPSWRSELGHALELTRPRGIVADAVTAANIAPPDGVELLICLDDEAPAGWLSFWQLVTSHPGRRPAPVVDDWGSLDVALAFSSGTTGLPKAVRHTHRSLVAAVTQWKSASTIDRDDRLQLFLPLFHIYGVITIACSYWAGASLTLFPRFDLDTMLRGIERDRTTIGFGVAPMAVAMANHPALEDFDLSSIRYFLWGASPMIPDVAQAVTKRTGIRWVAAYGTTEVPVLHVNPIHHPEHCRLTSPGLPVSDLAVKIADIDTRQTLGAFEQGEILVRSPSTMAGYLPVQANAESFEDGWFRTGDVGTVDADGWLEITDRLKEMLKVNGFQVAPVEVEKELFTHPAVADCAVYGVPNKRTGEAPVAAVVLAEGQHATESDLLSWIAQRLATYKHLKSVVIVDEIPRTASGKVLRRLLRDRDPHRDAQVAG